MQILQYHCFLKIICINKSESPYVCLSACNKEICFSNWKATKFGINMHNDPLMCISSPDFSFFFLRFFFYSMEPLIWNPVNWNSIFNRLSADYFPKKPYQTCQVSVFFFFFLGNISDFFQFSVRDVCLWFLTVLFEPALKIQPQMVDTSLGLFGDA